MTAFKSFAETYIQNSKRKPLQTPKRSSVSKDKGFNQTMPTRATYRKQ